MLLSPPTNPAHPPAPRGPAVLEALHTHPPRHVLLLVHLAWRCQAGSCDALTPVIVSPKCKAVAPSCGQVFSWEFYSGTVPPTHFPQGSPPLTLGRGGYRRSWLWETLVLASVGDGGVSQGQAVLSVLPQHRSLVPSVMHVFEPCCV